MASPHDIPTTTTAAPDAGREVARLLICASLVEATGSLLAPAYYLIGASVLSLALLVLLVLLRERTD